MIGEFYKTLVDQDKAGFTAVIFKAAALYILNSITGARD